MFDRLLEGSARPFTVAGTIMLAATFAAAGCDETDATPSTDATDTAAVDTAAADTTNTDAGGSDADTTGADLDARSDATRDSGDAGPDGGMCTGERPERIDCTDRVELENSIEWSSRPGEPSVRYSLIDDAIFGKRAVRLEHDEGPAGSLVWTPTSPADLRTDSGAPPVIRVAIRTDNPNSWGWQARTPEVTVADTEGRRVAMRPAPGFGIRLPVDGMSWQWMDVPLAERDGWRAADESTLDQLDLSAIEQIRFDFASRGSRGFTVDLDGLAFTGPETRCGYECPSDCHGRGRCDASRLRCRCEMGAVGRACGSCGEGFVEADDGGCELAEEHDAREWPNAVSETMGDAWLRVHHQEIEVLRPRVLVMNFANESEMAKVRQLLDRIVRGFELGSTPAGRGPDATPQLQYEIVDVVDMRNGHAGNPETPADYPHVNSTFWPREETGSGDYRFDYTKLFDRSFAEHYGFRKSDGDGEYMSLCELIERGEIHDLWIVGAHDEDEAVAREVLEYKQRYTIEDNPIPGSFSPCAGNGCFRERVSPCERSVRIASINYKRGPGCFLHNIAHRMEGTATRRAVPGHARWFERFAGMDLSERYDVPFRSLYQVDCSRETCITFPDASTVEIRHRGETYRIEDWDAVCGNCHFPPNGTEHYDYGNETEVRTTCEGYGRRALSCRRDAASRVSRAAWESYQSEVPDCGGGFLTWWYSQMPAHGTGHAYPNGEPMKSVWPYLFY